ncbi:hypothetical protein [Thioalkalivibrio sp. ALE9]|uniref:hypothetical protein n=1 Tax=Thioalkalivibrio sp. ALE9 TaxID=1158169 RepID=UPI00035E61EF|nr:hypothetical protein [Thioalkalivibrio sp. ALE9]
MGRAESNTSPSVELYLASTPLQILNAVEARYALGDAGTRAVLILFQRRWEHYTAAATLPDPLIAAFDEVLPLHLDLPASDGNPWTAVAALSRNRRSVLGVLARLSEFLIDRVVVTNQWNRDMRYLAAKARAEVVFADDGTSTASYLKACAEWGAGADWWLGFASRGRLVNLAAALLYRLMYGRFMLRSRPDLMFTCYSALAEEAGFPVVANEYRWVRSMFGVVRKGADSSGHFLGAPFVERGEVSSQEYLRWLREAMAHHPELNWIYIPHPAESGSWLEQVSRETGVECKRMNGPYELSLFEEAWPPAVIASWFSSALENLQMLEIDSELWAYRIPDGALSSSTLRLAAQGFYERNTSSESRILVKDLT